MIEMAGKPTGGSYEIQEFSDLQSKKRADALRHFEATEEKLQVHLPHLQRAPRLALPCRGAASSRRCACHSATHRRMSDCAVTAREGL